MAVCGGRGVLDEFTAVITKELLVAIREHYKLSWYGIHGAGHWARVLENGVRIAAVTPGARASIVELFAVFHDAGRINDGYDPDHGARGAELARILRGSFFELPDQEFSLLCEACRLHAQGTVEADITVQSCWDADRLDLFRVNIRPDVHYLCTPAAKDPKLLSWCNRRAVRRTIPRFALDEWFPDPADSNGEHSRSG